MKFVSVLCPFAQRHVVSVESVAMAISSHRLSHFKLSKAVFSSLTFLSKFLNTFVFSLY